MSSSPQLPCFACGELNTPDSRFCKFCGRPLVREARRGNPGVARDPRNRLMLILVLILIVAVTVYFVFGLLTSHPQHAPVPL